MGLNYVCICCSVQEALFHCDVGQHPGLCAACAEFYPPEMGTACGYGCTAPTLSRPTLDKAVMWASVLAAQAHQSALAADL